MSRFEADPHPALRPYVQSYWGVVRDLAATGGGFTVTPDRFLELVFFVDEPPWVEEDDDRRQLPNCTLIPLLGEPLRIWSGGVVRCAAVRFYAWAAGIFFPQADTSTRKWLDFTDPFSSVLPAVTDALQRGGWESVPPLLDRVMLRALSAARPAPAAMRTARAFVSPPDETAQQATATVAARQGRSRRQVERQVRALTHRSPKQLASLTRFQFVRDTLWAQPRKELAALAFEAGYADQAHLTRHFRRYTGQTPGEFLRDCARLKTALHAQDARDVAFLQDGRHGG